MGRHSAPRRGLFRPEGAAPAPRVAGVATELPDVVLSPEPAHHLAGMTDVGAPVVQTLDREPGGSASSRAGRNLPLAVGVGLGLGLLVVVPLFVFPFAFVAVVAAAVAVGSGELVRAVEKVEARPPLLPLIVGGLGMITLAWRTGPQSLVVGLILTIVATMVWRLADGPIGYHRDVTSTVLIAAYVPFLAGFCVLLLRSPLDGPVRVVAFVATVVCSDVGGYAAGVLFGRHPMAPTVSPKKSWEGMGGSVLACAAAGSGFFVAAFGHPVWQGVIFGVSLAIAATLGDLAESMIKRDLGVKDMGTILPGHGGVMDRLDSLLVAAPVAYLLLSAFVPVAS